MTRPLLPHWSLENCRAVVTGASSGIGLATARELAMLGAQVLLVARNTARVDDAVAGLRGEGREAQGLAADVATEDGRRAVRARVDELWGELQLLVNNVGTNVRTPTLDYTLENLRQVMAANVDQGCF